MVFELRCNSCKLLRVRMTNLMRKFLLMCLNCGNKNPPFVRSAVLMLRDLCQMPTVNDALKITIVVLRKGLQKIQTLNERIFHLETEISNVKMEKAKKELMLRIGEYVGFIYANLGYFTKVSRLDKYLQV
eukprot:TRINITY_DN10293_c0_g1_i3.p1 TRINITY_DN10293_c0_g1~~TRINITY_DN10293_c0_g1_i3.p1  ORF type:complete len:130 (-),score=37.47 TRINITY_DN10293_c0_g1_i3:199-588(-)